MGDSPRLTRGRGASIVAAVVIAVAIVGAVLAGRAATHAKRTAEYATLHARSVAIALLAARERDRAYPSGVGGAAFLRAIGETRRSLAASFDDIAARDTVAFPLGATRAPEPIFAGRSGSTVWITYSDITVETLPLPAGGFDPGPHSALPALRKLERVE